MFVFLLLSFFLSTSIFLCVIELLLQVRYPRADPVICGMGILVSAVFLTMGMFLVKDHIILAFILLFLGEIGNPRPFSFDPLSSLLFRVFTRSPSIYPSIYQYIKLNLQSQSICLPIYLLSISIYLSISICLPNYLSISIYLPIHLSDRSIYPKRITLGT